MMDANIRFEVADLVARFAHCSDFCDWAGLEELFVANIVTEMDGLPIKYEGIAAQVEHAKESANQTQGKNRHYYFNLLVSAEGDEVIATYMFLNVNAGSAPLEARIVVSGRHRDTVVKTDHGWKFAHRRVSFDQSFDLSF